MSDHQPHILAVDVGTSSLKAVVYGPRANLIASATRRYEYVSPQPGWAESNPEDWWRAFQAALADLRGQGFALAGLEAIAFTGQMHTAVLLDGAGQVLEPTILWLDRRAAAETEELAGRLNLPPYQINSTYTLPKLLWLSRHRPDVAQKIRTILWPKDYLRYRLTGILCTDVTEAGGAALLNWDTRAWAGDRLEWVGLPASVLPPARPADAVVGPPRPDVAEKLGLNPAAKVVVGMGDVAALIGGAPPRPGRVVCSLGSSSMVFMALAGDRHPCDPAGRLYTYPLPPYRLLGGVSSTTGSALVWAYHTFAGAGGPDGRIPPSPAVRRDFAGGLGGSDATFESAMQRALQVPPGADGLCFVPYLAGERSPHWRDDIRGGFYGLRLSHTPDHLIRAVMEGVAYSLRHLLDIYQELGTPVEELALAGGGTKTPGLSQIIADVCRRDVSIYAEEETVTRVLYALCRSALCQDDFEDTLVSTFAQPGVVCRHADLADLYQRGYLAYRRLAGFALQEATRSSQVQP
jgi:xylulokinase